MILRKSNHGNKPPLIKVRWHQWSVVRLASVAMFTVIVGYVAAAITAVQSIDQLLHMVHDDEVESSIRYGMDQAKQAYSARQELLSERLTRLAPQANPTKIEIEKIIKENHLADLVSSTEWTVEPNSAAQSVKWQNRQQLAFKGFIIDFNETVAGESFHKVEEVLQRYKVIGLELRERIRPALIRALWVTLAIMCFLLLSAFIVMTARMRRRVQYIVDGFVRYAEVDDQYRFSNKWQSELGLISQQFNRMADELFENRKRAIGLEKLASWQTIARKMAHEIKNPLTPIQIMIGQLKRNYKGDDQKYQTLVENAHKVILEEVSSLRRMVDDFSEFARLPRAELNSSDLVATAQKAVDLAESAYLPHTIRLNTSLTTLPADHDDQLLRHVIHNLIKNAAEADPKSDSPIEVRVTATSTLATVEVHDQGPGVPQELQDRIFEAYVTTKHTGPSPGMGLGLAICQKVVFEHGGTLKLTSAPGNTTFTITFPLRKKVTQHG